MVLSIAEIICYLVAVIGFFVAHVFWEAPFWLLYVAVGCATILAFFFNRHQDRKRDAASINIRKKYVSPYRVDSDGEKVTVSIDGKPRGSVAWLDLIFVGIRIMNEGFLDVPYWLLGGTSGSISFPSDAAGNEKILDEMQKRLPNFNRRAVIEAMGSTSGGWAVWERSESNESNAKLDTDATRRST